MSGQTRAGQHRGSGGTVVGPRNDRLNYRHTRGAVPTVVFLGGFRSDMSGLKARYIEALAAQRGQAALVLDYAGHGESGGKFEEGGISMWADDAAAVIERALKGPLILVGSSMGAWIMTLLARRFGARVVALLGIASAPDFVTDLMWERLEPKARDEIMTVGSTLIPSAYGDGPYPITRRLIEDGRKTLVLDAATAVYGPVRLIHGLADVDVPWERSVRLAEALDSADVRVELVKNGKHRLSEPLELARIGTLLDELLTPA